MARGQQGSQRGKTGIGPIGPHRLSVVEHARNMGSEVIRPELTAIAKRHPSVGEVRGLGVFWALELLRDRTTRQPLVPYNATDPDTDMSSRRNVFSPESSDRADSRICSAKRSTPT